MYIIRIVWHKSDKTLIWEIQYLNIAILHFISSLSGTFIVSEKWPCKLDGVTRCDRKFMAFDDKNYTTFVPITLNETFPLNWLHCHVSAQTHVTLMTHRVMSMYMFDFLWHILLLFGKFQNIAKSFCSATKFLFNNSFQLENVKNLW